MAEESPTPSLSTPQTAPLLLTYLEVNCRSSGNTRRFALGTEAGFAVEVINRKLKGGVPIALHIEAVKDGEEEEPIAFGPNSVLANLGDGWKLQTFTQSDLFSSGRVEIGDVRKIAMQKLVSSVPCPERRVAKPISILYIFKVLFAFIFLFVLGAIFTMFLDNLPELVALVKSNI